MQTDKINRQSQEIIGIKTLEEILELLRITKEYTSDRNRTTELTLSEEISMILIPAVHNKIAHTVMLKSMVLGLG